MKITINYPQILKMQFTSQVEVEDDIDLNGVKERVFDSFWGVFTRVYPHLKGMHGSAEDIVLKDNRFEIRTEAELRACLGRTRCFQATFEHP